MFQAKGLKATLEMFAITMTNHNFAIIPGTSRDARSNASSLTLERIITSQPLGGLISEYILTATHKDLPACKL